MKGSGSDSGTQGPNRRGVWPGREIARQKLQETVARFEHSLASEDTDESTMLHKAGIG